MSESLLDLFLWAAVVVASALPAFVAAWRLRRLRGEVASALNKTAEQHAAALLKLGDIVATVQKQQQVLAQQMQVLAIAHNRIRDEMRLLAARASEMDGDIESRKPRAPTLH